MLDKLLSISVAAYNVEQYLDKLVDTVVAAEGSERIELLIVNDGSTDGTLAKAEEYKTKYPEIVKVIDKPNGGHGSTINAGMKNATGKYFRALDGDDWVDSGELSKLLKVLDEVDDDLILNNFYYAYESGRIEKEIIKGLDEGVSYKFSDVASTIGRMKYHSVVYKTEFLQKNNIHLDEHCFYVDTEYLLFTIPKVDTVRFYGFFVYCYRLGLTGQSVSVASRVKHVDDSEKVAKRLFAFYKRCADELDDSKRDYLENAVAIHSIWHLGTLVYMDSSKENKKRLMVFDNYLKTHFPELYQRTNDLYKGSYWNKLLRMLRKTNYSCYPLCKIYTKHEIKKEMKG